MKVLLLGLLLTATNVVALSPHKKFVLKSRSIVSFETATGVSVPKKKLVNGSTTRITPDNIYINNEIVYQPGRPALYPWGLDNLKDDRNYDDEYWNNPRIHTLGNIGFWGAVHAALAPLSTHIIDNVAYQGCDIRLKVAHELRKRIGKEKARVLDMCCGVGMSTRALRKGFPDAEAIIGLDTSPHMVAMANFLNDHLSTVIPLSRGFQRRVETSITLMEEQRGKLRAASGRLFRDVQYKKGNAENTNLPGQSFDLVTVMYAFHEAPKKGREHIIKEARRLLSPGGVLAIVDISSDYEPSPNMLAGEPYVLEYQQNMYRQLLDIKGFLKPEYKTLIPGHVGMWTLTRSPNAV